MAALERILNLKAQGLQEWQIIRQLKDEGISPREIEEGLSQSKIKSAVYPEFTEEPVEGRNFGQSKDPSSPEPQMQKSIMLENENQLNQQPPIEQPRERAIPSSFQPYTKPYSDGNEEQRDSGQYYSETPSEGTYQEETYPEYQQGGNDIGTITDIAEQVVEEKTDKIKNKLQSLEKSKEEISIELENISERLKKLEDNFNSLQIAIIGKIGEYGDNIKTISKEIHATQDSFSKILNPLTDNIREMQKFNGKKE